MKFAIPLVLLAVLAQEPKKEPAVPSDRLPTIGTVGDLPAAKSRLVVEVAGKGVVTVEGKSLDLEGLRKVLLERADADREKEGAKASNLHVVLRADRALPWQGAQWLMQECASPKVRVHRILFAALPEDGGEEGAVATFLPVETRPATADDEVILTLGMILRIGKNGVGAAPADAAARIAAFHEKEPTMRGEIYASPGVTTGTVLQAVDVFLRGGVKEIVFKGTTVQRGASIEESLAARPPAEGTLAVFLLDSRISPPESPVPPKPVARVKGAIAGITAVKSVLEPELIPIERK